jgi:hypothetical protein
VASITVLRVAAIDDAPLRRHERKLFAKIRPVLPEGESLLAAALIFTGPEPNLVGLAEDVLSNNTFGRLRNRRKYLTLIVTDRRVILIDNLGDDVPDHLHSRFAGTSAFGDASTQDGDTWVNIDGTKYWFWPEWTAQIAEMQRIAAST